MPTFTNPSRLPFSSSASKAPKKSMPSDPASPSLPHPAPSPQLPAAAFPPERQTGRDAVFPSFKYEQDMPQLMSDSSFLAMDDDSANLVWEIEKVRASHLFDKKHKNFRDVVSRMKRKLPSQPAPNGHEERSKVAERCEMDRSDEDTMDFDDHAMHFQDREMCSDNRKMDIGYPMMDLDDAKHASQRVNMENKGSKKEAYCLDEPDNQCRLGDMVWAKVKSHPWWPGQVFDPALACSLARRTKRDGHVLVAFFGDGTFGWFQESELIPFDCNFSDKSKETSPPNFAIAVEDALDEVSRRFRSGLTCSCTKLRQERNQEALEKPAKRRKTLNLDKHLSDVRKSFDPMNFLSSLKGLACEPLSPQDLLCTTKVTAQAFALRDASFVSCDSSYQEFFRRFSEISVYNRGFVNDAKCLPVDSSESSDWGLEPLSQAHVKVAKEREISGLLKVESKVHISKVSASQIKGKGIDHDKTMQDKAPNERSSDREVNSVLFGRKKGCHEKGLGESSKGCRVDGVGLSNKKRFNAGDLQDSLEKDVKNDPHTGIKRLSEDDLEEFRREFKKGFQEKSSEESSKTFKMDDRSTKAGLFKKNDFNARQQDDLEMNARNAPLAGIKSLLEDGLEEVDSESLKESENKRKERKRLKHRRHDDKLKAKYVSARSEDRSLMLERSLYDALPSENMEVESSRFHAIVEKNVKGPKRLVKSSKSGVELNLKSASQPQLADSGLPGFQASMTNVLNLIDVSRSRDGQKEHIPGSSDGSKGRLEVGAAAVTSDAILNIQCMGNTESGDCSAYQNMVPDPLMESIIGGSLENDASVQENMLNRQAVAFNPRSECPEDPQMVDTFQMTAIVNAVVDGADVANVMSHMPSDDMGNAEILEMQTVKGGVGSFAVRLLEPSQSKVAKTNKDVFQNDIPVGKSDGVVADPLQRIIQPVADIGTMPHLGKLSLQKSSKFRRLVKGPKVSHMQIIEGKSVSEKATEKNILDEKIPAPDSDCQITGMETRKQNRAVNGEHLHESVHPYSPKFQEAQNCQNNSKEAEEEKPQQCDSADGVDCLQEFLKELLCLAVDHFSPNSMETISKVLKLRQAVCQGFLDHSYESFEGTSDVSNQDDTVLTHRVQQTANINPPNVIGRNLNADNNKIAVSEMSSHELDKQKRLHKNNLTVALEKTKTSVFSSTKRNSPSSISLRPIPDAKIPLRPLKQSHMQVNSIDNSSSKLTSENNKASSPSTNHNLPNEPAALCMKFPPGFAMPSEAQLRATFARFGSLSSSGTRVNRNTGSAQVVFRRACNAEKALKHVQENNVFGQISVSYMLKQIHVAQEILSTKHGCDFSNGSTSKQHDDISSSTLMTEKHERNAREGKQFGKSALEHTASQGSVSLKSCLKKVDEMLNTCTKNVTCITLQGQGTELEHVMPSTPKTENNVVNNDRVTSKSRGQSFNPSLPTLEGLVLPDPSLNTGVLMSLPEAADTMQTNLNGAQSPFKNASRLKTSVPTFERSSLSASSSNVSISTTSANVSNKSDQCLNVVRTPGASSSSALPLSKSHRSPGSTNDIGDQMLSLLQRVSALVGSSGGFVL